MQIETTPSSMATIKTQKIANDNYVEKLEPLCTVEEGNVERHPSLDLGLILSQYDLVLTVHRVSIRHWTFFSASHLLQLS